MLLCQISLYLKINITKKKKNPLYIDTLIHSDITNCSIAQH